MGRRGGTDSGATGQEGALAIAGAGTTRDRTRALGAKTPKEQTLVGPGGWEERGHPSEEGHRSQDEVRLAGGSGPLHPVGELAVRQRRQSLEGQGPPGAVHREVLARVLLQALEHVPTDEVLAVFRRHGADRGTRTLGPDQLERLVAELLAVRNLHRGVA